MTGTSRAASAAADPLIDLPKESVAKSEPVVPTSIIEGKYDPSKRTRWRQWLASISATLSMVAVGTVYGWTTTILSRLMSGKEDVPLKISTDESSWIVSLTVIGSMIGPFLGACLADRYGRKRCLLLSSGFFIVGWIIVLLADTVTALYVARVILGIGVGVSYTTNPMYVSEVADVGIRGALGTLIAVNVFTGSLLTCSIGPWLSYRALAATLLVVPIVFVASFVWFPESPHYLAAKGRRAEATVSLAFFKGIRDRDEARRELDLVLKTVSITPDDQHGHPNSPSRQHQPIDRSWVERSRLMLIPSNRRALCIILGLVVAQQFSGNFSTMQYLEVLFSRASIGIDTDLATILVLGVGLISATLSTATVEGAGRRPLLIISTLGSSISLTLLAVYLMLDARDVNVSSANLLPVIDVILFQIAFQIGLGTLPNALIGELFPTEVKALAGAIITVFDGLLGFAVSKLYQVIGDAFGTDSVYYFFAASCLLALIMVILFVPETKGRTLREIQELLVRPRRSRSVPRVVEITARNIDEGLA